MARRQLGQGGAQAGAWLDEGLRMALHKDGCRLLEELLCDPNLEIAGNQCRPGEKCHPDRIKDTETVLGTVHLRRHYFYKPGSEGEGGQGRFPLDEALGLINGYSPGMAKLMCRAGAMASGYEAASADLKAYAGLEVEGRQIQRMVNLKGAEIQDHARHAAPAQPIKPVEVCYVSVDGTGVPMAAPELEDRPGKQDDGSSKTREVKLGCVFTQQKSDEDNRPLRDPNSTTYVSSFSQAKDFGPIIRTEALRRGMALATLVVLLGDGALWIWEIARSCFSFAVQIVDFFHACEHLTSLAEALFGQGTESAQDYRYRWQGYLEVDQVEAVIAEAHQRANRLADPEPALKAIGYFENNKGRMLYETFRDQGLFIGSGVVEAGCKTVVGQRAKESGMFWSVAGAENALAIRCSVMNADFDGYWREQTPPELQKAA